MPLVSLTARKAVHESETNKAVSYVGLLSVASSRKDEGKPRAFGNGLASRDVLRLFYFIFSIFLVYRPDRENNQLNKVMTAPIILNMISTKYLTSRARTGIYNLLTVMEERNNNYQ